MTAQGLHGPPNENGPTSPLPDPMHPADARPSATYGSNTQRVTHGIAIMGSVDRLIFNPADGDADGKVVKPRFREGPYPPDDIVFRLRAFVDPPSYVACWNRLTGRQLLLLRGETGTGTSTAALSLLRGVTRAGRITGLDSATDLTEWTPSAAGGYLVQGISPESSALLDEVALNRLTDQLRVAQAFLVVIVPAGTGLPRTLAPWCEEHVPPDPSGVARALLKRLAEEGELDPDQVRQAYAKLDDSPFKEYLAAGRSPATGVEAVEELREMVVNGRTPEDAADNLRLGSAEAAEELLRKVRGNTEDLALAAAVALLEEQDRSVVERLSTRLRPLLAARIETPTASTDGNLLGRSIQDRLIAVQAKALPRSVATTRGYRYWTEPVVFRGKHLAEEVLRRLWLDYEGFSELLLQWLRELPYEPGLDHSAGRRIGRVLCQGSGPDVLRELDGFARSPLSWQRRLAGYALGEVVQDPVMSAAVRVQLRQWSRVQRPEPRCTVAETCAGSLGLALPSFALKLLHTVMEGTEDELDANVQKAVSAAFGVLLTEKDNRGPVLQQLTAWLVETGGTARHSYAVQATRALCTSGFPATNRVGARGLKFADVFTAAGDLLVPLVLAALGDRGLYETMSAALTQLEDSLEPGQQARMDAFLTSLTEESGGHQGLRGFLLARYRLRYPRPVDGEFR
ncbi:hypothetical protein APS67_005961 [Streptomyces sp. AVP053U2]|nr:hypothetical protein APS67_005961 [Streptomyces sp. AVP053U2]